MTWIHSDILAELDLPASGITRYEQLYSTDLPKGVTLGDWSNPQLNEMMIYYSAQVQLRVILNRVHSLLYQMESPSHPLNPPSALSPVIDADDKKQRQIPSTPAGQPDGVTNSTDSSKGGDPSSRGSTSGRIATLHRPISTQPVCVPNIMARDISSTAPFSTTPFIRCPMLARITLSSPGLPRPFLQPTQAD